MLISVLLCQLYIIFLLKVKRPGDKNIRCTILLLLDYQPLQFKLDPRLARLLGVHTQTRPVIINALWQYIKTHKLQVIYFLSNSKEMWMFYICCTLVLCIDFNISYWCIMFSLHIAHFDVLLSFWLALKSLILWKSLNQNYCLADIQF